VPGTSSYHAAAQIAAVRILVAPGVTGDDLRQADGRLSRLTLDEARRQQLTVEILRAGIEAMTEEELAEGLLAEEIAEKVAEAEEVAEVEELAGEIVEAEELAEIEELAEEIVEAGEMPQTDQAVDSGSPADAATEAGGRPLAAGS